MANTASAKKQARESQKRALRNRSVKSAVKTHISRARRAAESRDEGATDLAAAAVSSLDRAASKGILHPNNAARRKSRLMRRLNAAGAEPAVAAPTPTKAKAASSAKGSSGKTAAGSRRTKKS